MSDTAAAIGLTSTAPAPARRGIDLAVLRRGARDYLDFLDRTKEVFFAFLYHRTGSIDVARALVSESYIDVLSRAMSLWWFGALTLRTLLDAADRALRTRSAQASDLDQHYVASLPWFTETEKQSISTLHDALWTMPTPAQRLVILSLLVGMPASDIAAAIGTKPDVIASDLSVAQELFLSRWQPSPEVRAKLSSLVYLPLLDIAAETSLRFAVVEKYNALRFRRYQWVVLAGLFAVMSNVIVAGLILFMVVVAPPTTLRGTRTQVASLDAVLLERRTTPALLRDATTSQVREVRRIAARDAAIGLTDAGLSAARSALHQQQQDERDTGAVIDRLRRGALALIRTALRFVAMIGRLGI